MAYLQPARNVFTVKRVLAILLIVALQCPFNVRASTNLGSKCQHDMDCTDFIKGSACSAHGYCECAPYFVQYNATSCLSSQLLGGDCILDDQCTMKVANSSCSDGACRCVEGFLQFRKHTCLGPAHPGAVCYSHAHCGMFDKRTHCDFLIPNLFGRCQCTAPTKMVGGLCVDNAEIVAATSTTTTTTTTEKLEAPTATTTTTPSTTASTSTTTTTTTSTTTTTEAPQFIVEQSVPIAESVEDEAEKETFVEHETPAQFDNMQPVAVADEAADVANMADGSETESIVEKSDIAETVDNLDTADIAETIDNSDTADNADTFVNTAEATSQQTLHTPADVPADINPANDDDTANGAQEAADYPYKIDEEYAEEQISASADEKEEHAYEKPEITTIPAPAATAADVLIDEHHEEEEEIYDGDDLEYNHGEKEVPVDETMKFDYETAAQEELAENADHITDDTNVLATEQEASVAAPPPENVLADEVPQAIVPISADGDVEIAAEETTVGYNEQVHEIGASDSNNEGDNSDADKNEVGDMQDKIESDANVQQVEEVAPVAANDDADNTKDKVIKQEMVNNEVNALSEDEQHQQQHHELIDEHEENKLTDQHQDDNEQSTDKNTSVESDLVEGYKPDEGAIVSEPEIQSETEATAPNEDIHVAEKETDISVTEAVTVDDWTFQTNNDESEHIPEKQPEQHELNEAAIGDKDTFAEPVQDEFEPIKDAEAVETAEIPQIVLSPVFESEQDSIFEESQSDKAEEQATTQSDNDKSDKVVEEANEENVSNLVENLTDEPVKNENVDNDADKRIADFSTDQPELELEENSENLVVQIENDNAAEDNINVQKQEYIGNNMEAGQKDQETEISQDVEAPIHNEFENIIEGAEPIFEVASAPIEEQQEVQISEAVHSVEDEPIKMLDNGNIENPAVEEEINISENSLEIESNPSSIDEQTATTSLPELDYSNVESFEKIENEQSAPIETVNVDVEKINNNVEVENQINSNDHVSDDKPQYMQQAEVVHEAEQVNEDFKESESIADILSDLMAEEETTTVRSDTLEAPKEDEIELNHKQNVESEIVPHHETVDDIPDLIAEDTNISEEKLIAQEEHKIDKEEEETTEAIAETEDLDKLITFYPEIIHENVQPIEKVVEDNKVASNSEPNSDKLITFFPEITLENEPTNEEIISDNNKDQSVGEQNIAEDVGIDLTTESSHFDEPERTLSPEELPFDMSMEDAIQPQELESDNLVVETTTNSETDAQVAAVSEAAQQNDHEAATANPSDIVEITTQTMLGLASRVTLMEPAAPVATTLKPLMNAVDDVTPEPTKALPGAQTILTTKATTEIRKRVELGLEAVSLGLTCFNDKQCQLADPNAICNTRGICDCAAASAYPAQTQCSAERTGCSPGTFQCRSSGVCISWFFVCDGRADCNDASDEECSFNARLNQTCPAEAFHCKHSGRCISRAAICDGRRQCPHGEDEIGCSGKMKTEGGAATNCPPHTFRCNSGECLPEYEYCNAIISCKDGSDEPPHLCGSRSMPNFFLQLLNAGGLMGSSDPNAYCPHRCSNGRCRSTAIVCSGRDGCGDGTDEQTCSVCRCPSPARESLPAFLARHRPMPLW